MNDTGPVARGAAVILLATAMAGAAWAQATGGSYAVKKAVIAGGSASASGGDFRTDATLGQAEAGVAQGGDFRVQGGFWPALPEATGPMVFRDGFEDAATR